MPTDKQEALLRFFLSELVVLPQWNLLVLLLLLGSQERYALLRSEIVHHQCIFLHHPPASECFYSLPQGVFYS